MKADLFSIDNLLRHLLPFRATAFFCICLAAVYSNATNTVYYVNDGSTSNDVYCSAIGSDAHSGLSAATPVASLQTILDRYTLDPGDTVKIDSGTYLLTNNIVIDPWHSGSWEQTATIRGNPGQTILDRQSQESGSCCLENNADYLDIYGLTFCHAETGLYVNASSCSYSTISLNYFYSNRVAGLVIEPEYYTYYGNFEIANNLLHDNGYGMRLETRATDMGDYLQVHNNTVLVSSNAAISIGGYLYNCTLANNILVAENSGVCYETTNGSLNFSSEYNALCTHDGGAIAEVTVTNITYRLDSLDDWQIFTQDAFYYARDIHSFNRDPLFADPDAKDFHLRSSGGRWEPDTDTWVVDPGTNSPCIDTGSPYLNDNLSYEQSPNGGRINMGAFGGTIKASKSPGRDVVALAPNLGLDAQWIYWETPGGNWSGNDFLRLDYSTDNGESWQIITNGQAYSNDGGYYEWYRPQESYGGTNGCLVRVAWQSYIQINDIISLPYSGTGVATYGVYYVNDGTLTNDIWCTAVGDSSNDGRSPATPVDSLQTILDRYALNPGNIVFIDSGTYLLTNNIVINSRNSGTWDQYISIQGNPEKTIFDRQSNAAGSCCLENHGDYIDIYGLTFRHAEMGLYINASSCSYANISQNTFYSNSVAGLVIEPQYTAMSGSFQIANNLMYDTGDGMRLEPQVTNYGDQFQIFNNTVIVNSNAAITIGGNLYSSYIVNNILVAEGSGACYKTEDDYSIFWSDYNTLRAHNGGAVAEITITNTIFRLDTLAGWQLFAMNAFSYYVDSYSFNRDPLFADPATGDFHLRSSGGRWISGSSEWYTDSEADSPCIDTGDPNRYDTLYLEPDPNGARMNMGAYGGTPYASKSPTGRVVIAMAPAQDQYQSSQWIYWNTQGSSWSAVDTLRLDYSIDNGESWQTISTGQIYSNYGGAYEWFRPADSYTAPDGCLVRVALDSSPALMAYDIAVLPQNGAIASPGGVYYVNDNTLTNDVWCTAEGDSSNDGLSPATPVDSLQTILERYTLELGNIVYVDSGTYLLTSNIVIEAKHSGSSTEAVTITGNPGLTILDRQYGTGGSCCMENHANYLDIKGFTFRNAETGLFVNASECSNSKICQNTFYGNSGAGLVIEPSTYTMYGSFLIANNLMYNTGDGMRLETQATDGGDYFMVYNNTVMVISNAAITIGGNLYSSSSIANNILAAENSGTCYKTTNADYMNFSSDYNTLWVHNAGAVAEVTVDGTIFKQDTLADWQCFTWDMYNYTQDTHSFNRDPQFTDPPTGDFHLRSSGGHWQPGSETWVADAVDSPCIDTGNPYMYDSLESEPDPNGERVNMGVYGGTPYASKSPTGRVVVAMVPELNQSGQWIFWENPGSSWSANNTFRLDYSIDNGETWQMITNGQPYSVYGGSFEWFRPQASYYAPDGCLLRVAFEQDTLVNDIVALPPDQAINQYGSTYYVNDGSLKGDMWCTVAGNLDNNGLSPESPLPSIQAVIDRYSPTFGSIILVDSGTYSLNSTLVLPNTGDPGEYPEAGWFYLIGAEQNTILTCQDSTISSCITVNQDFTYIDGFVFHGGTAGITVNPQSCRNAAIINNKFIGQTYYGINVLPDQQNDGSDTYYIQNNVLYGGGMNLQSGRGYHLGAFSVINNTVVVYSGAGIACGGMTNSTTLVNNIISAKGYSRCLYISEQGVLNESNYNNLYAYNGATAVYGLFSGSTYYSLTLMQWQSVSGFDMNSFNRDPLFVAPYSYDFHLRSKGGSWHYGTWAADSATSPCVDAGDPDMSTNLESGDNGGRINIGAYGGTEQASRTSPQRTLLLLSPQGGETWDGEIPIDWEASGSGWTSNDSVRIEISTYDGTWSILSGASELPPTGSFNWVVPDPPTTAMSLMLQVVCNQDKTVYDATDSSIYVQRLKKEYFVNDDSTENDHYCSAPGATDNTGTSAADPLPSLDEVLSRYTLKAGDAVYVDRGVYVLSNDTVISSSHKGTYDDPILIRGAGDGSILMRMPDGGTGGATSSLTLYADYIRVENITCVNGDTGISVDASSARHAQLIGNSCYSNSVAGIKIEPMGNIAGELYQILQNVIAGSGTGLDLQGSPDLYEGRTVFVIENNTINCEQDGICVLNTSRKQRLVNLIKNNLVHTTQPEHSCIVTLQGGLHYSDFNNLYATNGASVGAWYYSPTYSQYFPSLYAWKSANGKQDTHSISTDSHFVSPVTGNYRVQPYSPCVDAGVNSFWMFDAKDRDDLPRITGKSADIGAYELNLSSSLRFLLGGAFLSESNCMTCALSSSNSLPYISPYADDKRKAATIPDNATDWVLVQFRELADGPAVYSRSAFLRNDGWIINDDGTPGLEIDLPANEAYYIVVKHRNHLAAMSAEPVPFSGQMLDYDFTTTTGAYYAGSNGCMTISTSEGEFHALLPGDADGDGEILDVDQQICLTQTNLTGYYRGDVNCDGIVTAVDSDCISSNLTAVSPIPRPAVILQPALLVSPARSTLTTGEDITLSSTGGTTADSTAASGGTIVTEISNHWAFAHNYSGAELTPVGTYQAAYTSGSVTGLTDIVESWNRDNRLGRALISVISTQSVASAGKAMIVAGRKSAEDTLWPTTDYLADNAYSTLRYRGFSKENILYLNPEPDQDVDSNGLLDDIDAESTFHETAENITNGLAGADQVFLYLVDHGGNSSGNGYFRLNSGETLTAAELDSWLDTLQDAYNMKVTVLLDFCYAGSFISALTYDGEAERIVVAACNSSQPSYFVAGGLVSFSGAFFSGVLLGYDVMHCFELAQSAMSSYQSAQLDDDRNGIYNTNDGVVATDTYIGPSYVTDDNAPQIGEVCGNQVLSDETAATLWIGSVTASHPISQVWCLIVPPGHNPNPDNPVTDLPQLDLTYDSTSGRYGITYDGFTAAGSYQVQFYAQDEAGNISAPRQAYVTQIGYNDRVIFVAGGNTNSSNWTAINYLTHLAYTTLRLRLFTPDHICLLSSGTEQDFDGDGTNDVAAASSVSAVQDAFEWATSNTTDRLTLYLLGEGTNNTFMLNESECLTTNQLATWLQAYQATNPIPITVILDFSGSGAYVPSLAFEEEEYEDGASRIVIASAHSGREALLANEGTVSYSQYFLSGIISGESIGSAHTDARRAIRRVSGDVRQRALIDDNHNGVASEKNIDGLLADETSLGSAFITGADSPEIGEVIPITALETPGAPVAIWAANVAGMNAISNVWCVVTPPGSRATEELETITLSWNESSNRYDAVSDEFQLPGSYMLTFYAQDELGEISDPVQSEILLADAYEPDDTAATASLYTGLAQQHNFHTEDDTDWTRVYLVTNFIYDFETYHFSDELDTVLDIYRELPDGTLSLLDHVDEEGSDYGEYTGIDFPQAGWYWTRVTLFSGSTNTPIGSYELSIEIPAAEGLGTLIVLGIDDVYASALPTGSTVTVTGEGTVPFNGSTSVVFANLTNGTYLVSVPAPTDFIPREDPSVPNQVTSLTNMYYANPRQISIEGGWCLAGFEMFSTLNISSGEIRDAWTHAFLGDARIFFTSASDNLEGLVATGSVFLTDYCTNWLSSSNGQLPSNIVIGSCDWDLGVTLTNYEPYAQAFAVSNETTGADVDLGSIYLIPVDTNSNSVADYWEEAYFPGGMSPTEDSDSDGVNNRDEYYCGTDPTNALSVLQFLSGPTGTGTASMVWSTVGGRSYQIMAVTSLVDTATMTTNGPWEASHDQESMEWIDPDASSYKSRFYRVRLYNP